MTRLQAIHVWLYRWFVKLTPPTHRQRHGNDQVQLFTDLITTGHRPGRLWVAAVPDLFSVLRTAPGTTTMSNLTRLALGPLSVLNAAAGLALMLIAIGTSAVPAWVAAPASVVAAQGIYTLAWLVDRIPVAARTSDRIFAIGETAALVFGTIGVVAAIIRQSATSDPEYGPPTMTALVAIHALMGLLSSRRLGSEPAPTTG